MPSRFRDIKASEKVLERLGQSFVLPVNDTPGNVKGQQKYAPNLMLGIGGGQATIYADPRSANQGAEAERKMSGTGSCSCRRDLCPC